MKFNRTIGYDRELKPHIGIMPAEGARFAILDEEGQPKYADRGSVIPRRDLSLGGRSLPFGVESVPMVQAHLLRLRPADKDETREFGDAANVKKYELDDSVDVKLTEDGRIELGGGEWGKGVADQFFVVSQAVGTRVMYEVSTPDSQV